MGSSFGLRKSLKMTLNWNKQQQEKAALLQVLNAKCSPTVVLSSSLLVFSTAKSRILPCMKHRLYNYVVLVS